MNDELKPIIPGGTLAAMWDFFRSADVRQAKTDPAPPAELDEEPNPAMRKESYP
jgi:hypothetical protein